MCIMEYNNIIMVPAPTAMYTLKNFNYQQKLHGASLTALHMLQD